MPALVWPSAMGSWTVDSVLMCGPGWCPETLEVFWVGAPNRGTDRVIPGVSGSRAYGRHVAARTVDVPMKVSGSTNQSGTPNSNETSGLTDNLDTIYAGVVAPPTPPTVTRTSTLTMPDASTREAEIVVEHMSDPVRLAGNLARVVLTITIPGGAHYAP